MKLFIAIVAVLIMGTQWLYWIDDNGVRRVNALDADIAQQREVNDERALRNKELETEVLDLKNGLEAVEERARSELGMIGTDETFYLLVD